MAACNLCGAHPPDSEVGDHLRLFHPDAFADIERWPDGRYVIYDDTLQPGDFGGAT